MKKSRTVHVKAPAVFHGFGPVNVHEGGALFYTFDPGHPFRFTLPVGTYTVEGADYVGPYRPPAHLTTEGGVPGKPMPGRVRVIFAANPNKCSINLRRGVIICDPSIRNLSRACLTFVLFHEIGHYYHHGAVSEADRHEQECLCDAFAARQMLIRGWNPSQIAAASEQTLSLCSERRKAGNWETMKNAVHVIQ